MSWELMRILKRGKTGLNIRNINVPYYLLVEYQNINKYRNEKMKISIHKEDGVWMC